MKMITGYLPSDIGNIEVCGVQTGETAIDAKQKIGYLPEANPL
jgi:ABC-2 type transport system ATP-binding protein